MAIIYLDVDDEITSAASRIRSAEESKVALVLPGGSRIGTSRINFRLLAREAQSGARSLAIVSPEASTRALAASAGLPVFVSVFDYEAALAAPIPVLEPTAQAKDATIVVDAVASAGPGVAPVGPAGAELPGPASPPGLAIPTGPASPPGRPPALPVVGGLHRRHVPRLGLLVGLGIVALIALLVGVGGYLLLPSADVELVVRPEPLGPIELTVTADPAATSADTASGVVPAERPSFELSAADTFPATGKRVVDSKASGRVTFDSINTVGPVSVPRGTKLSTLSGEVFATTASVTVPPAKVAGEKISHGTASVGVQAASAGPDGNVEAGSITQVPGFLQVQQVSVSNPAPTSGGEHQEFPRVTQKDVDKALASLTKQLDDRLTAALGDPAQVPTGRVVFDETVSRTEPVPTVDPATLVGQEAETFDLGLTSTGGVTAIDLGAVRRVAEQRLLGGVPAGYDLVPESVRVDVGAPTIEGVIVTFPSSAGALIVRRVDEEQIRREIAGQPVGAAEQVLAEYGDATVTLWPDWVTTIPTYDFRLRVEVRTEIPTAGSTPEATPEHTTEPSSDVSPQPSSAAP